MSDGAAKRGRPKGERTAADRKRDQRADRTRATAENIRRTTIEEFERAVLWHCELGHPVIDVMALLDRIADRFPAGPDRHRVFTYYMPVVDSIEDAESPVGHFPDRQRNRRG